MVAPGQYFQQVITELRKVDWPTWDRTRKMTILVIVVSLLAGAYIGGLDFLFQQIVRWLLSQ